jgi:ribonuclease VapC
MVVDTSALVAVLFEEPERDALIALLADADDPLISAATLVEASIVMRAKTGHEGVLVRTLSPAAIQPIAA